MSIKVNARQTLQNVGKYAGKYRYVMQTELYNRLTASKVVKEASLRSGIPQGSMSSCWNAIGEVIKAWATEGHSVAIPGLGSMRFSVRAESVEKAEDVSTGLIKTRRVIFVPSVDIKDELKRTSINITCFDKDGNIVKQVTSKDDGEVEDEATTRTDPEDPTTGGGTSTGTGTGDNGGDGDDDLNI